MATERGQAPLGSSFGYDARGRRSTLFARTRGRQAPRRVVHCARSPKLSMKYEDGPAGRFSRRSAWDAGMGSSTIGPRQRDTAARIASFDLGASATPRGSQQTLEPNTWRLACRVTIPIPRSQAGSLRPAAFAVAKQENSPSKVLAQSGPAFGVRCVAVEAPNSSMSTASRFLSIPS